MRKSVYISDIKNWVDKVIINGKTVDLPEKTPDYCIYDNKIIIGLSLRLWKEKYPKKNPGRNICCYRDDGTLLWEIEESPKFFTWPEEYRKENPDEKDYYDAVIYYKGLRYSTPDSKKIGKFKCFLYKLFMKFSSWRYKEKGEWLWARTRTGYYDLDPETGKVSNFHYDGGR